MHAFVRLFAAGLCAVAAASAVHAQQRQSRSVTLAPSTPATSTARPASAAPNPAGLRPPLPAGISSGSGAAVSSDPVARNASPIGPGGQPPAGSGTVVGGGGGVVLPPDSGVLPNTAVMGAGATVAGPGQYPGASTGAGGFAAADQARSFFFADANHDNELTRAESRRLSIATMSFEEMDRNYDGVISRFEYEDSLR